MGRVGPEGESGEELGAIINRLRVADLEIPLGWRLIPLKEEESFTQIPHGQQNLPGTETILTPICELDAETIPSSSPFHSLYPQGKLVIWSFNSEGIETKEGMFLIAIREEEPTDENFPWNIGWVTEEEIASLFQ